MKNLMKLSVVLVAAALAFSSCNCFKKMAKNRDEVNVTVTPEILTLNNGVVAADIHVTFPVQYYNKKAVLKVTPVIVFEGGEVAGTTQYFQGSKVDENYTTIDKKNGGNYTMHVEFPYDHRMDRCALQLRAEIKCPKGKCKEFTLVNLNNGAIVTKEEIAANPAAVSEAGLIVAYGLNTLQKDMKYSDLMVPMANNYKKVTTVVNKTDLLYAINSSKVTKKNQQSADLDAFKADVDEKLKNDRATQNIAVKGYASPDGPEKFNDKLSKARSESGKEVIAELLKDSGLDVDAAAYGEDWDGFKEVVEKSDIKDKDLILKVLGLYNSPAQRESEIKNLSSVFEELKSDVLPELRRAQIVNSTDIQGKTDAEIMAFVNNKNYDALSNEELLYAAESLTNDPAVQAAVLEYTAKKYNDARAYNNLGIAQEKLGQKKAALHSFETAAGLQWSRESTKNLILSNLSNGNTAEAKKYAADAQAAAAIAAAEGRYNDAAKGLEGYNAAVAQVLNNDLTAAKKSIAKDNSAEADYLRAVIAAKEGDLKTAEAQLKSAISKAPELAKKAATDINLKALAK